MTQEEKRKLEEKVEGLRKEADQAAAAAAADPGKDDLQQKAEQAEDALATAEAELEAAVVDDEETPAEEEPGEGGDEHIDFEEELKALEGGGEAPPEELPEGTELEKAAKALYHNARRLKELGGDVAAALRNIAPVDKPPVVPPAKKPEAPASDALTIEHLVELEFGKIAKSDAERKVYLHHYKHSIQKTGNLATDMENAMLIANKGRILKSFGEIKRGNVIVPHGGSGPGARPPIAPKVPQVSSADASVLRRRGFVQQADGSWKGKRYTLTLDPKTKAWVEKKNA